MNPFLIEPVYKRPKRKPAAKKKPAVKRKAPVRKPAAKRRPGSRVVYVEDYVTPHDPLGLWSATPKDIIPLKASKVPLAAAGNAALKPAAAVAPVGKAVGGGGFMSLITSATNVGKHLAGNALAAALSATAGGGAGPSQATEIVKPSAPPLPEANEDAEKHAAAAERKAEKAAELKALRDLETGKESAVQPTVQQPGGGGEGVDEDADAARAWAMSVQPMLRSINVPARGVANYTTELRKLASVTTKHLGERASPKYLDKAEKEGRYIGDYVYPAVEKLGGIFAVMAMQDPKVLEKVPVEDVAQIRRVALGQPKGTSEFQDKSVSKTKQLSKEFVASALKVTADEEARMQSLQVYWKR